MIKGLIKGIKLSMLGMMTTGICCTAANCVYAEENNEIVKMQVFYENGCRSCNEQKDLQEMINEKTGAYKDELPCEVTFYNMFKTEEREEGNEILQENQLCIFYRLNCLWTWRVNHRYKTDKNKVIFILKIKWLMAFFVCKSKDTLAFS